MTGCSVVRGAGSPLLERHGSRPLKHQGQKETVQLLALGTPSHAPLHQRTLQTLAAGPVRTFQTEVINSDYKSISKRINCRTLTAADTHPPACGTAEFSCILLNTAETWPKTLAASQTVNTSKQCLDKKY